MKMADFVLEERLCMPSVQTSLQTLKGHVQKRRQTAKNFTE